MKVAPTTQLTRSQQGTRDAFRGTDDEDNDLYGDASESISDNARGGNDTLVGGDGSDPDSPIANRIYGDTETMSGRARGGSDVIQGGTISIDWLVGDAHAMTGDSVGGNDRISGGSGPGISTLTGDAFVMAGNTTGGSDWLRGGADTVGNVLYGDAPLMMDTARGGHDDLRGGDRSHNELVGDAEFLSGAVICGNDILRGGDDCDGDFGNLIVGDGFLADPTVRFGNDVLISGTGSNDWMWGDLAFDTVSRGGADRFVFSAGNGADVVGDFQVRCDKIVLVGMNGILNFKDLTIWMTDTAEGALIDFGGGHSILLAGVPMNDLGASDFVIIQNGP